MIFESEKKIHVTLSDVVVNLNKFEYLSAIPGIVSTRGHNSFNVKPQKKREF